LPGNGAIDVPTGQLSGVIRQLRSVALLPDGGGMTDGQLLECFITRREEAAFAALVRRHGPMVLGVCRRALRHTHDAEDAFQATFLVLARKATSIGQRELLGNWLYGAAYRAALEAKAARRRVKERQVSVMPEPEAVAEADVWLDLRPILDQELSRLPDKYRVPVVLCDLEGRTRRDVARQLNIPAGTLSGRLTTARRLLAKRLARHGLAVPGGALAATLFQNAASACVPSPLVGSTVKAAILLAAGQAAPAGLVSAKVAALTEGVLKTMLLTKLKIATAVLLVGVLAGGAAMLALPPLATGQTEARKAGKTEPAPNEAEPPAKKADEAQVAKVLSADGPVDSVAWSPDGKTLAALNRTGDDGQGRFAGDVLILWDARTGQLKRKLFEIERPGHLHSVTFSADGKTLACIISRLEDGKHIHEVKMWNAETGKEKALLTGAGGSSLRIAFSPDSKKLAAGADGGKVYLWDLQTDKLEWEKEAHADGVTGLAFSAKGETLASGGPDKEIKLWDAKTGDAKQTLSGHEGSVYSLAFSSDEKSLASGGLDGTVRIWDAATGKLKHTLTEYAKGSIVEVAFSLDGKTLASGGSLEDKGVVKLWDAQTGELKRTCPQPLSFVRAIAFAPDGRALAIGSWDQTVKLWRWEK
jgi:RNA polymerase sigma factor (sigma-70 family)